MYDINKIREDFPILSRTVYNKPLVYLDNAATTQKPRCVVDALVDEYYSVNANVHRGVHYLSQKATDLHEAARETVRKFINAEKTEEIVFTRGTTESINLIASSYSSYLSTLNSKLYTLNSNLSTLNSPLGDIIVTHKEHHSNIVPWQLNGFKVVPWTTDSLEDFEQLITERTRMVSVTYVSNVLGEKTPVKEIIDIAHRHGVPVLIDGAQSTPHLKTDVRDLDCDFFVFSGHKVYGPTGIGVLYGKEEWLEKLPPYQGGGEMIKNVSFERTTFEELPFKFEAGTPDYIASNGLAKALDYISNLGLDNIMEHESQLRTYALDKLSQIEGLSIYGHPDEAVISFNLSSLPRSLQSRDKVCSRSEGGGRGLHHLDVGTLLDRLGIAVRTGHHCAQPLMHHLGIEGTVRASFALYNTKEEIDNITAGLRRIQQMF